MDPDTIAFYERNASAIADRYESVASPVARYFAAAFPAGCRLLDIGAGSGRDLAALIAGSYEAFGVEPTEGLRIAAIARHPELAQRIEAGALPAIGTPFGGGFDGLLCSAVLMHVPEVDLFDAAFSLRRLLRPHGRLLISLPLARSDVEAEERDGHGRLFRPYAPEQLQLLFERIGFQMIGRWDTDDALGRTGTRWYTILLELQAGGALRAVDQIEGILNRDKKVTSYKLALFRALAELAMQEPRIATWRPDGVVEVPVGRLAEKWLGYYWPIFAAPDLVPQAQTEGVGAAKPVKFRRHMSSLMLPYLTQGEHGGLAAWLDLASGRLSASTRRQLADTLKVISRTIRLGPVEHAGGALDSGRVFTFDQASGGVLMTADLWRELSLLGHWIVDAVILRWAELTERFGRRQGISAGAVLPLLLARPEPERATGLARQIFSRHGVERCTWTDRKLVADFAVDHLIPFSMWGSNDLWNLVPADRRVNGQKSDRLPTSELLHACKGRIVHGWQLLRQEAPVAFDAQGAHLLGRSIGGPLAWHEDLFTRLREAVEITALQRGVERWAPRQQTAHQEGVR